MNTQSQNSKGAARHIATGIVVASAAFITFVPAATPASASPIIRLAPTAQAPVRGALGRRAHYNNMVLSSYSFANSPDGAAPTSSLIDIGGQIYGTTESGGGYACGTIFHIDPTLVPSTEHIYYNFCQYNPDGNLPVAGVVKSGPWLYGSLAEGGSGTGAGNGGVYRYNGLTEHFYAFDGVNQRDSSAPMLRDSGGRMWGTSARGGTSDVGTLFYLSGNNIVTCHEFTGADGGIPVGSLVELGVYIYGTTLDYGSNNVGTVFKIKRNCDPSTFASAPFGSFPGDGASPYGGLVKIGTQIYGTTTWGGAGDGTIYKLSTTLSHQIMFSFPAGGLSGAGPVAPPTIDGSNTLWGTTEFGGGGACSYQNVAGCGTVYKYTLPPSPTSFQMVYPFQGGSDGASPYGKVLFEPSNGYYGTTEHNGSGNVGTVWRLQ